MIIDTLKQNAEELIEQSRAKGASEAQVVATHSLNTQIRYEKNDFVCTSANTQQNLGLKVHVDGKRGTASTNELGAAALADTAGRAVTLAGFSIADDYLIIPEPQAPPDLPGRDDPALRELSAEALHTLAADFVKIAASEKRLSVDGGEVSLSVASEAIANSKGLMVTDSATRLSWSLMGMGKTETEVTSFDYLAGGTWNWAGAAERAEATAKALVAKLLANFGPRKGESYKGMVLLSPAVLGELLYSPIAFHVSGSQLMDGKSRWENSIGESVAASGFTLVDNPFNLEIGGATPYDAEGVSVRLTPIIEGGILRSHIDSSYTANRRGTKSTGHAGGVHGLEVSAGASSIEAMHEMTDQLVVVERFSGNLDPVSGDFSGIAKNSHYYKGGENRGPLTETMIAGNFFELLNNIVALGDEQIIFCNQHAAPWMLVDGVSVTAG